MSLWIFYCITNIILVAICFRTPPKKVPRLSEEEAEKLAAWKPTDKVNPWEISGKFQGDIILLKDSRNGIVNKNLAWPNKVIPFDFDPSFNKTDRIFVEKTVEYFNQETCVKFRPKKAEDVDYIHITQENTGCWSYIGRVGGPQILNLQQNFCVWYGTVLHEFMHALGFYHQHGVPERDIYITINWNNVEKGYEHNFDKNPVGSTNNYGEIYDYSSIMHYTDRIFSVNGLPTIQATAKGITLGRNISLGLSATDLRKIRKMYNC